ncbi:MAG TPA: DegV family protein [Feifaniaceae bacterium]|nr:DegV family protein [Feifaniaceae bacterium]
MCPKKRTCIVAQTGCDMLMDEAEREGILLVPDRVMHKDKEYLSLIDIDSAELYHILRTTDKLPTSAHSGPTVFIDVFKRAQAQGYEEIICIVLTSKMSGSINGAVLAATLAKEEGFPLPVHVYDSLSVSHGMGIIVREANRLANEGLAAREIMERLDAFRSRVCVYFMLESLKCAWQGGRVSALGPLFTDKLGIRPLFVFQDGLMRPLTMLRNAREGMRALVRRYEKEADRERTSYIFHGDDLHRAQRVEEMILAAAPEAALEIGIVGPPIGLHGGPSSVGLAFVKREAEA